MGPTLLDELMTQRALTVCIRAVEHRVQIFKQSGNLDKNVQQEILWGLWYLSPWRSLPRFVAEDASST